MEIQGKHLWKSYGGVSVLRDVNFILRPGIHCLMSPSGQGKTTLLRILLGLETPDSGELLGAEHCRWAAVFQEDRLLEGLSARENLRFALGPKEQEEEARALLAALGLDLGEKKPVCTWSGGMKRRLALARALLAESDALALDEPFTGLDRESRARAIWAIAHYTAGKPVLLVTHEEGDALALGAKVLTLDPKDTP